MVLSRIAILALVFCFAACASPEATRTRGGGPGGDVGNKKQIVRMHEGARPFYKTPQLIPTEHPPLETAHQADDLSRG